MTDIFDLVIEELHANGFAFRLGGKNIDDVSPDAVSALGKIQRIPGVLKLGESPQYFPLIDRFAADEMQAGENCGSCHDGSTAFGVMECTRCHIEPPEPVIAVPPEAEGTADPEGIDETGGDEPEPDTG